MSRKQSKWKEKQLLSLLPFVFYDFGGCSWYLGFLQPHSRRKKFSSERGAQNGGVLEGVHSGVRSGIQGSSGGHQKDNSSSREAESVDERV